MKAISQPTIGDKIGVIVLGCVWALAFIAMRYLAEFIAPLETAFWRVFIATISIGIGMKIVGTKFTVDPKDKKYFIAYGIIGVAMPFTLLTYASQSVSGGTMSLLTSISPFVAIVFNHFLTKDDTMTIPKVLGAIVGFIGVCIVLWEGAVSGSASVGGSFMVSIALVLYVISSRIMRQASHVPALVFVYYSLMCTSVVLFLSIFIINGGISFDGYDSNVLVALLILGLLPTAFGWAYRFVLVNRVGYSFVSLTGYIIPVAGLLMGSIFLGEEISPNIISALVLVLAGLWISAYKKKT